MIDIDKARQIVLRKIYEFEKESGIKLALMENETIEFESGWLFFYQSEKFIKTQNEDYLIGGNAPIIVDRYNSSLHVTGTSKSDEFYINMYEKHRDDLQDFYNIIW